MRFKLTAVWAVVLALLMCALSPMQVFAYSKAEDYVTGTDAKTLESQLKDKTIGNYIGAAKLYISDMRIATGKTADEAKKALHDAGYLVYECNLNEGTETPKRSYKSLLALKTLSEQQVSKKYTYIGYKITTDRSKAITNLFVMDEEGGYSEFSYKKFAESRMPGLQTMVNGMQASCGEMRKKLSEGSYAAEVAKEYLDLFCVPETSTAQTGIPLGDYLLDTNRKTEDFRDLFLVLDTLMLNMINSQLALGISGSEVCPTQAKGGLNEDGTAAGTYTSRNGITGYTKLTGNNGWLQNAAEAMVRNTEFANVNKTDNSRYFAEKMSEFGAQIAAIKRAIADNTLSSAAVEYLKSERTGNNNAAVSAALGITDDCTVYDLLTKGSDRMLCLFLEGLPEICGAHRFLDALEICATDCKHRLPVDFTYDKQYDIDWAPAVVKAINNELLNPSDKAVYNAYNTDIEAFVELFKQFTDEYEAAVAEYDKDNDKPLADFDTPEQAEEIAADVLENQTEVDPASYIYYVGIRKYFSKYTVRDADTGEQIPLLDYLIEATKGQSAADEKVKARIYPVVNTLGEAQKYSYKSNGMLTFFVYSVLGTDELAGTQARLAEQRLDLKEAFGSENFSIWVNSNKDLSEREMDSGVAMTSRRVMDTLNSRNFENAFPVEQSDSQNYKRALAQCGTAALCSVAAGLIAFAGVKLTFAVGGYAAMEGVGLLASLFSTGCGMAACFSCVLVAFSALAIVVIAVVAIVYAILLLIEILKPEPTPVYTQIPDIMLDCIEDGNNYVTGICRYNVVRDIDNKPADINAFSARKWIALYYTKNRYAGSPLTLGPDGEFFAHTSACTTGPEKSVPLAKFLTASNFNLNNHCYFDTCSGIYLHYYSEDSLAGKIKTNHGVKKYIDSIVIGHSDSDEGTRAYVLRQSGYQLLDANLSPNAKYDTFIAFHTTDDRSSALTDIRAAYASTAKDIFYGDNEYHTILDDTMLKIPAITCEDATGNRKQTAFSYGLYTSKSLNVGDPLLAVGIGYTTEISEVPEDAEVISYFGGMPLDFNTYDRQGNDKDTEGLSVYDKHCYVYFRCERDPEVDYTGKTYLSGMSFFAGSQDWLTSSDTSEYSLENYAEYSYGCKLIKANLTPGLYNNDEDVTYLGYIYTHNPKRALTDLAVFTGEPKSGMLPQNITVAGNGYCSCDVYTQGDYYFYGKGGGYLQRLMRSSHTFFTAVSTEYYDYYWPENVAVMPRALYACGPQTGVGPIELADVVFSTSVSNPPTNTNDNAGLSRLTTSGNPEKLDNQILPGTWHSVHAIDQYYFDEYDDNGSLLSSYDIGLGRNPDSSDLGSGSLYIYYKNGTGPRTRGTYVRNVALCGSNTQNSAYNEARISALAAGEDIVNLSQPLSLDNNTFNDIAENCETYYGKTIDELKNYSDNCYYVAVSYTDNPLQTVGSVRILEQKYGSYELAKDMNLPLYDLNRRTNAFRQSGLVSTDGQLGLLWKKGDNNPNALGKTRYGGYASYISHAGTAINRVELRYIDSAEPNYEQTVEGGAAEYYAQAEDTLEPFIFETAGAGRVAICLLRDIKDGRNENYYIMNVKVLETDSAGGNMALAAANLGAMGYPYIIDFDIAESKLSYGSNKVAVLGVERTSNPTLAIKDIRLSSDDLGPVYTFGNMCYRRVNDKPVLLEGGDKNGMYIYTTDGSDSRTILWSEVDIDHTDWENFDWAHLDFEKSAADDPTFNERLDFILNKYPTLREYVNRISSDDFTAAENSLRLKWSQKAAITNIGYSPSPSCAEQSIRYRYEKTAKEIYWAGCPSYGADNLPSPVTDSTSVFAVSAFGNAGSTTGLRFTNAGNAEFFSYESPADRIASGESASVFAQPNIVAIVLLSVIFLTGFAAAYIIYRRKRISKEK